MGELLHRLRLLLQALTSWAYDLVAWVIEALVALIKWLLEWIAGQRPPATQIEFWSEGQQIGGSGMANELQLHNDKKRHVELIFKDDDGEVAPVDGMPDIKGPVPEGIVDIQLDDDHMGFQLFGKPGVVGDCEVTVTADVDKGEGFKPLTESLTVHAIEAAVEEATDIEFKAGEEEDI